MTTQNDKALVRLVRYGELAKDPSPSTGDLTPESHRKALELGAAWRAEDFVPQLVISSPTPCAMRTTEAVCMDLCGEDFFPLHREEFYMGHNNKWRELFTSLSKRIGDQPPHVYLADEDARRILMKHAKEAWAKLLKLLSPRTATHAALFGDELLLIALEQFAMPKEEGTIIPRLGPCESREIIVRYA